MTIFRTKGRGINSVALSRAAKTTVLSRLLAEADRFSRIYLAYRFRDIPYRHIEADEIWAVVWAKEKNVTRPD